LRHYVTSRKVAGSSHDEVIELFFNIPDLSSCTLALGSAQPLTEMSTRSRKIMLLASRSRPVRRAGNLTVICEPNI
jgi:hypothetical protein